MNNIQEPLARAMATLVEVTTKLAQGVNKTEFERQYQDKFVSPGISVRRHIEELRISGSLEENGSNIRLKRSTIATS